MRNCLAGLAALALLAVSGCDTIYTNPTIVLQEKEVTFRFEFSSEELTVGEPAEIRSTANADLSGNLDGYTKAEIVSATVNGVDISRIQPVGVALSTLGDVALGLTATGVSRATVAQSSTLPTSGEGQLSVLHASVTSFVTAQSFSAVLTVVPASLRPNSDYVLTCTLRLRIEVEGV